MSDMRDDIASVLLSAEDIQKRTAELGARISKDFDGREPLFVGVLKGCFVFMADLMRSVTIPCSVDFMAVSSYGNQTTTTGAVKINKDLNQDCTTLRTISVSAVPRRSPLRRCWTNLRAAKHRSTRRMPALKCRMHSSSATALTTRKNTAISRSSVCSSRRYTPTEPDTDS